MAEWSELEQARREKIRRLRAAGVDPYPARVERSHTAAEANPKQGLISNESPLGQALLERKIGDEVEVKAPAGVLRFKIVKMK